MGRGKGRGRLPQKKNDTDKDPISAAFNEAANQQQRAERRRGLEAIPAYESAFGSYRQILDAAEQDTLSSEQIFTARFGLANSLANAAECLLKGVQTKPDNELQTAEASANDTSRQMLQEAIAVYQQIRDASGVMPTDALVDCGNTMASLAELESPPTRLQILEQAAQLYRQALQAAEDAAVYSNLGDVLVSAAEVLASSNHLAEARGMYSDAMTQYDKSCTLSSSDNGDDLPGLLHNWGVGLQSAGSNLKDKGLLQEAVMRLRSAVELGHSDVMIINALGDTFLALSELLVDPKEKLESILAAQKEGFGAALAIDRRQPDALVGSAEVEMLLGRGKEGEESKAHFQQSMRLYSSALERHHLLGSWADRCSIRYNHACAACLAGSLEVAQRLIQEMLNSKLIDTSDLLADSDFQQLSGTPFWSKLQSSVSHPG